MYSVLAVGREFQLVVYPTSSQMESFLPSEIGRLIYGYLSESNQELADSFLNKSKVMEECRLSKNKSRRFSAKVQGLSLIDILDQYSILCALIFKQVPSSECAHQNILKLLKNILYTKVRERNEQLAEELLSQNFNIADFVRSDTSMREHGEINDSRNESVLRKSSVNTNHSVIEISAPSVDNSFPTGPDIESMDVSSSSISNESKNLNKTVEKTIQTDEPMNVISLSENVDSSSNVDEGRRIPQKFVEDESNEPPEKSKPNSPIDSTTPYHDPNVPTTSKVNETIIVETSKDTDKRAKSVPSVICKAKQKLDKGKHQVCKSKLKNALNKSEILSKAKPSQTKPQNDQSSNPTSVVLDNITVNPNYRKEIYVTPLKRNNTDRKQADELSHISPVDNSQSNSSQIQTVVTQSVQPVIDNAASNLASRKAPISKTIPNILKLSDKSNASKSKTIQPPNQDKPPPAPSQDKPQFAPSQDKPQSAPSQDKPQSAPSQDKPQPAPSQDKPQPAPSQDKPQPVRKSNPNEPVTKPPPKSTTKPSLKPSPPNADRIRELHIMLPRTQVSLERRPPAENPHLQRPPPIIEPPTWDTKLRTFVGDVPPDSTAKTPRKTPRKSPRKTPRKQKREATGNTDNVPNKKTKLDESATTKSKTNIKSKTDRTELDTSKDKDTSVENIRKEDHSQHAKNIEPQSTQLPNKPPLEIQKPLQRDSNSIRQTTESQQPNKNHFAISTDVNAIREILRAVNENAAKSHLNQIDEIEEYSEDGCNLTLESEVLLYEANLSV